MQFVTIWMMLAVIALTSCGSVESHRGSGSHIYDEAALKAAASALSEIRANSRGENDICKPAYESPFRAKEIERVGSYTEKDIYKIIDSNEYRIIFTFIPDEKENQISVDVSLKDKKCVGFSIDEVFVN